MTDDPEKLLGSTSPRGAPAELRASVLDRVAETLAEAPSESSPSPARRMSWETRLAWAVAALLLVGVGLNFAVIRTGDARLAQYAPRVKVLSPSELIVELAESGASNSDLRRNGRMVVYCPAPSPSSQGVFRDYQAMLNRCIFFAKEPVDAFQQEAKKNSEMGVHRSRGYRGDHSGCQRPVHLDHRFTA